MVRARLPVAPAVSSTRRLSAAGSGGLAVGPPGQLAFLGGSLFRATTPVPFEDFLREDDPASNGPEAPGPRTANSVVAANGPVRLFQDGDLDRLGPLLLLLLSGTRVASAAVPLAIGLSFRPFPTGTCQPGGRGSRTTIGRSGTGYRPGIARTGRSGSVSPVRSSRTTAWAPPCGSGGGRSPSVQAKAAGPDQSPEPPPRSRPEDDLRHMWIGVGRIRGMFAWASSGWKAG